MRKRILTTVAALLCAFSLFSTGVAPAMAATVPAGETQVEPRAEEVRWYYRIRDGVKEMRLWSLTYQYWKTDWIPVPDGWETPMD